jgi:hypothetical protein
MKISLQDAQIMRSGSARFPTKGTTCVPACCFYWCCQNGEDGKNCVGFQLINGQVKRHLQEQLGEDALKYVQNAYGFIQRAIQNENLEGVEVITRDVSQLRERTIPESTERASGFAHMLECAHGVQNDPTPEPEPQEQVRETGLLGMMSALGSKTESHPTLTRAIDESQFPDFCDPMKCPSNYARHCSANQPSNYGKRCVYKTLTTEQLKTHSETRQIDNDKLNNLLARLETLEKEVVNAENSPKNDHIFPNRPNLCKTKNPNGLDEE